MATDNKAFSGDDNYTTPFSTQISSEEDTSSVSMTSTDVPAPYAGMPKEVLLHYSRQRKFVIARYMIAATGVTLTLLMLSMVIAFVAISPGCQKFYQTSPIYQVYPKSFQDSDNSTVGDLKGIKDRLSHFSDLGVKTLWLNPVYTSPQVDNGYDISDHKDIDPMFGTLDDMKDLIQEMHDNGMYLVMDFVPNHTSDQHEWFLASSDPNHPEHEKYKDYYVWVDGVQGTTPNNWQSIFTFVEDSAWEWHPARGQYYYHQFYHEQPDLNLRNKEVQNELLDILRFWLELGVDGFRCDAVKHMFEAKHLHDNTVLGDGTIYPDFTENQVGIHDVVAEWRELLAEYSTEPGVYRFMETEVYDQDIDTIIRYHGTDLVDEADFSMNFQFVELSPPWSGTTVMETVKTWMDKMQGKYWPNWTVGNHDNPRSVTRLEDQARLAAILTLTLPGTPGIYYGEEIGMENSDTFMDADERIYARTPMQWDSSDNAGFSGNDTTWLPVNDEYPDVNVEVQSNDTSSIFALYKSLIQLRSNKDTYLRGWLCLHEATDDWITFIREMPGEKSFMTLINFSDKTITNERFAHSEGSGTIVLHSSAQKIGDIYNLDAVNLQPYEGMVVEFKPSQQGHKSGLTCYTSQAVCKNGIGLLQKC